MSNDLFSFTKMTAAGNDFICVDNTDGRYDHIFHNGALARLARLLCRRGLSVGADGLVFAEKSAPGEPFDLCARFIEPDGSEAKLCGNGTACFVYWAWRKGLTRSDEAYVSTKAGATRGVITSKSPPVVRVCIPIPRDIRGGIQLEVLGRDFDLDYAITGVPHVVAFVDHVDSYDVAAVGEAVRRHPSFTPDGVNANFTEVLGVGSISNRTFEFGVEAETLACGTGSATAAIFAALRGNWPDSYFDGTEPVSVRVRSGGRIRVWFECPDRENFKDVCIEAEIAEVYHAELAGETLAQAIAIIHDTPS